jgi:hypothetical protein
MNIAEFFVWTENSLHNEENDTTGKDSDGFGSHVKLVKVFKDQHA